VARIIKVPGFNSTDTTAPNVADYLIPYGNTRHHSGTSYAGNAAESVITTAWTDLKGSSPLTVAGSPYVYKVAKTDGTTITGTKMTGPASTHGFSGAGFPTGPTTIAIAFAMFNAAGADFPLLPKVQGRRLTWSRADGGFTVATSGTVGTTPKITVPMATPADHGRAVILLELATVDSSTSTDTVTALSGGVKTTATGSVQVAQNELTSFHVADVSARGSGSGVGVFEIRAWQRILTADEKKWVFGAFADANGVTRAA
jgi:hypothetical protein